MTEQKPKPAPDKQMPQPRRDRAPGEGPKVAHRQDPKAQPEETGQNPGGPLSVN